MVITRLLMLFLFLIPAGLQSVDAKNYYKVLGIQNFSSTQEIRRGCTIKQAEIKTKLNPEIEKNIEERKKYIKDHPDWNKEGHAVEAAGVAAFDAYLKRDREAIDDINAACDVLQNSQKKLLHDKNLPREKTYASMEALREKCLPIEMKIVNDSRLLSQARSKSATIDEMMGECPMPKRWPTSVDGAKDFMRDRAEFYGAELSKLEQPEQKKEKKEEAGLTGMRAKVAAARAAGVDVKLSGLIGGVLASIPMPSFGAKIFGQDFMIKDLNFIEAPFGSDVRQGLGFTGTVQINRFAVKATVFVVETIKNTMGYSLSIALPESYKLSDIAPEFKKLDELSLPQAKLVLSSFDYTDPDGYGIKLGLNFASRLDLSGPLKMLETIKDKASVLKSIIIRTEPIRFEGVLPFDVTKTSFSAVIPLRFGIDLTKIPKMPTTITDIFKEITTDDFLVKVTAPPKLSLNVTTGVRLVLGTQAAPLRFLGDVTIDPTNVTIGVRLQNMLELKYFALGNAGVQFDFDEGLLPAAAALGIPFTGMGVRGELDLGPNGDKRVNMKLAGAARVTSSSIPDIMFDAEANNLQFGNLLYLYNAMVKRLGVPGQIPESKIPIMNIDHIKGYVALEDVKVAGREYNAGFKLAVDAQLFDKKFGFDFDLRHKALKCSGSGYLPRIDIDIKKVRIMTLSDANESGDKGPTVHFDFDARNIPGSTFGLGFLLEIPGIDLKNKAEVEYSAGFFRGDVEMTYVGFTTIFYLDFDPKNMKEMLLRFGFKGDFEKFLSEQAIPALNSLNDKANTSLAKLDAAIGNLSEDIGRLKSNAVAKTDQEIQKTKHTITSIQKKIEVLKKECNDASKLKKVIICPKVGGQIAAQGTALAAQKGYLEGLLKPGKEVIKSAKTLEDLTKAVSDAEVTRKTVTGLLTGVTKALEGLTKGLKIFKITKAIGEVSIADLAEGKMPRLVSFEAELVIPDMDPVKVSLSNLQFDFKNPKKSGLMIVQKVLEGVKIGE